MNVLKEKNLEKLEQLERGLRIKRIREKELKMKKSELGKRIGVSGQFLGLVEDGKGNLMYKSLKKLKDLSGHSADYILYGIDDDAINEAKICLNKFSGEQIILALDTIKEIALFLKDRYKY